jgi:hypothetical protein
MKIDSQTAVSVASFSSKECKILAPHFSTSDDKGRKPKSKHIFMMQEKVIHRSSSKQAPLETHLMIVASEVQRKTRTPMFRKEVADQGTEQGTNKCTKQPWHCINPENELRSKAMGTRPMRASISIASKTNTIPLQSN